MQSNITITLELVNSVLQYLASRPYSEVVELISAIHAQAKPQVAQQAAALDGDNNTPAA